LTIVDERQEAGPLAVMFLGIQEAPQILAAPHIACHRVTLADSNGAPVTDRTDDHTVMMAAYREAVKENWITPIICLIHV